MAIYECWIEHAGGAGFTECRGDWRTLRVAVSAMIESGEAISWGLLRDTRSCLSSYVVAEFDADLSRFQEFPPTVP